MIDKRLVQFCCCTLSVLVLSNTFLGMLFHSVLTPIVIALWIATVAFVVQYIRIPFLDKEVSQNVILSKWKTNGERMPIIGHAGGSFDAPANTLESFREAAKNGADGVEFDLCLTKDSIGVLMHDDSIDRTTDGSGLISEMTYEDIKKLDASAKHPLRDKFKNAKVPTFEEAIQECEKLKLAMYIDVKTSDPKIFPLIAEMFKKYKLHQRAIVSAFNPITLYMVKALDAEIVTVQLMRPFEISYDGILSDAKPKLNSTFQLYKAICLDYFLEWSLNSWMFYITGVSGMSLHHDYLSRYMVDRWQAMGFDVIAWTVNDKIKKELLMSYNVPVITDSIKL